MAAPLVRPRMATRSAAMAWQWRPRHRRWRPGLNISRLGFFAYTFCRPEVYPAPRNLNERSPLLRRSGLQRSAESVDLRLGLAEAATDGGRTKTEAEQRHRRGLRHAG